MKAVVWAGGYSMVLGLLMGVAQAQETPQEVSTLSSIKVRAQNEKSEGTGSYQQQAVPQVLKLPMTLQELPQSATVITRQRIEDQGLDTLGQVMEQSPGVSRRQYGDDGAGYTSFQARGFNITNYVIDGVPTTAAALQGYGGVSVMDTAIYDNVAIVRGATGLLSGVGEPSASIMMQRKRPTAEFQGQVLAGVGSWDRYRGMADISGPLNDSGSVRGRLVAAYDQSRSWKDGYKGKRDVFYGVIEADLGARTVARLGLEHMDNRYDGSSMHAFSVSDTDGNLVEWDRSDSATAAWAYSKQRRTMAFAQLEHEFNDDWSIQMAVGRSWLNNEQLYGVAAPEPTPQGRGSMTAGFNEKTPTQDTADITIKGRFQAWGQGHDIMLGANYYELSRHDMAYARQRIPIAQIKDFDRNLPRPDLKITGPDNQRARQWGAYAATRLRLTDNLALIAGGRVTNWKDHSNTTLRKENGVFTPYAGLVYDWNEQWATYASYTQIFNPQSSQDRDGNYLDPEKGNNYELGVKYLFPGEAASASLAVFQTRKDNLAVVDGKELTPSGTQAYTAASNTRSEGIEFEINGELAPGWQMGAGYTHYRFRGADGEKIKTDIPADQVKLFTTYRLPGAWHKLTVGGSVQWQSKIFDNQLTGVARETNTQKAYTVVDLMARYAITPRADLTVNFNNIFDKTYRLAYSSHTYGAPRNVMASLRYQF
ncbi:TonB-dependent siderophore receptor [Alcaligenes faecalis]|uniref:TonB-dependent siderophore receptor n=1 Tax=Alcaligenes faecalis TaxID=511 RepID=UPI0005A99B7A|nr:TonB-dependent siderophore receptor [Alcaligenes faecalis]ATI01076.1 TonB-dependent siderophore receptor [Alcaligenes faecalis]AYZ90434.1 TonB-dependent siderophore receptor [Alcaligenes faecalis]MCX5595049.1 TonB-dependent siderophore receptor [Alcaligenes faecalis]QQC33747.1 TonB-dependent siderophore receptor [Alcaligenes faecalis]CAJ0910163.1 outer-membrane receptor for ferric coprogen and ferric-rhodotorulic acid [Alcaligenes faecalis subsp. faecalis]